MAYLGVTAVKAKGRALHNIRDKAKHPVDELPLNHRLVVILGNGAYEIAADVTRSSEYEAAYASYYSGAWTSFQLYTLPNSLVAECPDEGRVPIAR